MSASTDRKKRQEAIANGTDKKTIAMQEEAAKKKKENRKWTIGGIIVAILIAAILLANSNFFYSKTPAVKVGSTRYSAAQMDFYYRTQYLNFMNQYGSYASMFGLDTSKSLKDQECTMSEDGGTWYDYFMKQAEDYVHVVRDAALDRLTGYLKDGEILLGGRYNRETRWMETTLLGGISPDSPVMREEIFGPVFPVLTFRDRAEVAAFVNSREKPLAFYYFGKPEAGWELIGQTSSGGACINDTIMHIANSHLPFGGVGNSGMGSYHSERSFLAFSHERAVVRTPVWPDLAFRYMPYKFFRLVKKLL